MSEKDDQADDRPAGRIERARTFFAGVRNELKRVNWPTWKEIRATTIAVVVMSSVVGLYLWSLDQLLDRLLFWIFRRFGVR